MNKAYYNGACSSRVGVYIRQRVSPLQAAAAFPHVLCSLLNLVLVRSLRVVLGEHCSVLRQQPLLLLRHDVALTPLLREGRLALHFLLLALLPVRAQLLLPQAFNLALVLQLAHPALLLIHLLQALVLSKLLKQLLLKVFLESRLFGGSLRLKPHLELLSLLEFLSSPFSLFKLSLLLGSGSQLTLLVVEFVAEVLLEFLLAATLQLFSFEAFENAITDSFSFVLCRLNLIQPLLLLLGVLTNHLVFVSFHLLLPLDQSTLLVHRQDHVSLGLLHFQVLDPGHFSVFVDHALDDRVDLVPLLGVLVLSFAFSVLLLVDLRLDAFLVLEQVVLLASLSFSSDLILDLFGAKHDLVDLSVVFLRATTKRVIL